MRDTCDYYVFDWSGRAVDANGNRMILDPDMPIAWPDYGVLRADESELCEATRLRLALAGDPYEEEQDYCPCCGQPTRDSH